jgi:leader peptidase (prepilin peptidase)/N-methyltransferase
LYFLNGLTPLLFLDLAIWSILTVILVYDIRHKIIPDFFVALVIIFGYIRTFSLIPYELWFTIQSLWVLLAGPILFVPFYLLWKLSQGTWMGLGDGKLAIGIGALLGLVMGISAITLGFWIGAAVMLLYLGIQKLRLSFSSNKLTMKSEIPFAPFLIIGLWIVFYFKINVLMIGTFLL